MGGHGGGEAHAGRRQGSVLELMFDGPARCRWSPPTSLICIDTVFDGIAFVQWMILGQSSRPGKIWYVFLLIEVDVGIDNWVVW